MYSFPVSCAWLEAFLKSGIRVRSEKDRDRVALGNLPGTLKTKMVLCNFSNALRRLALLADWR